MERDKQMQPGEPGPNLPVPARSFSTPELEAVIRRALELQAGQSALTEDGVGEADVIRIGQELGLEPSAVQRAMAEVRTRPAEEHGTLHKIVGAGIIRTSRVMRQPATNAASLLDRHLCTVQLMVVQRRTAGWTRYVQDSSIAAGISRVARGFARGHRPLKLKQLDVAISPLDADSCLVELSVDLAAVRGGLAAGMLGSSSVLAAGWAGSVWATAIADPLMLLGLPVFAGSWVGMRAIYRTISRSTEEKIESLLDQLEHGEIG